MTVPGNDPLALRIARQALDVEPATREGFVTGRCGDDDALRERVVELLALIAEADEDTDTSRTDPLLGTRLGPFLIVAPLGRGGTGVVYRAEREGDDFSQVVAVKLIRRGFDFGDIEARFLRERRILARLTHPHLARFIDGGVAADGRPWFALEYVEGMPITRWCDEQRLDLRQRVRLFLDACAAVQYAHAQLVVHRDLKPDNVLVDGTGAVHLLDFGIAGLLEGDADDDSATLVGTRRALTPEYAAPEQFGGGAVGVSADVYALGMILYRLIAGVLPYTVDRGDFDAAARAARETAPAPLAQAMQRVVAVDGAASIEQRLRTRRSSPGAYRRMVRGDLSRIIGKALAKEPERRYSSVEALAEDLSRWLAGAPVRVSGDGLMYRTRKFVARNRVAVGITAVLGLSLLGATGFAFHNARLAQSQRDVAQAEARRTTAVRDYLTLMFREAAEHGDADKLSARNVLRQGAENIVGRFADQPRAGQDTALALAELYMMLDDTEAAAPLLNKLLAWPGIENNPEVLASARYNLAQVDYLINHREEGAQLLRQAQDYWSRDLARHANRLAESRTWQAQYERAEGRLEQAVATLQEGIAAQRSLNNVPNEELAIAYSTLTLALLKAGRVQEALLAADEAHAIVVQLHQEHTTRGLAILNNRASVKLTMGDFAAAAEDLRVVVDLNLKLYGRSANLGIAESNLAVAYVKQGQPEQAVPLMEDALQMAVGRDGERSRAASIPRINLVEVYAAVNRTDAAAKLADLSVDIATRDYPEDEMLAGLAYRARTSTRLALNDHAGARADLDEATRHFNAAGAGGRIYLDSLTPLREILGDR